MEIALTADEIYALAAADGARPDPLLTIWSGRIHTEHCLSAPQQSRVLGAPIALRTCAKSWTASLHHLRSRR